MESNRDRFPETRAIVWRLQSNRDGVPELCAMNHGVGAEGVLAAQSALTGEGEFGNDGRVEQLWALKAIEHAEVYFNLLCAIDPSMLKLTGSRETDDEIYTDFKKSFPHLQVAKFTEEDLKAEQSKADWREFCGRYKHIEDFSLGTLLRMDSSLDYSEENTMISVKIQFFAIEIARNREGFNSELRNNFKPAPRKPKRKVEEEQVTRGGVNMSEIEAELKQVLGGSHPLLS